MPTENTTTSLAIEMLKDGTATLAQTTWVMHDDDND